MIGHGYLPEPPAIRGGRQHRATRRGVVIVDVPHAPFASGQHLLGLSEPLIAVAVVFRDDQLAQSGGVARGRGRIDHHLGLDEIGDMIDPIDPGSGQPAQEAHRGERGQDPKNWGEPGVRTHSDENY